MLQWVRWYKQIYEMPSSDRPDDDTIENDTALDLWFKHFLRNAAKGSGGRAGNKQFDMNKVVGSAEGGDIYGKPPGAA